jgi:hypothetical protein
MFTYTYERQDIIQIALKRLPGGGEIAVKKGLILSGYRKYIFNYVETI